MSGPIVWVGNNPQGRPIASIDNSGAVRTLDMEAVRTVAGAANPVTPTNVEAIALLLLRAYELGKAAA